MKVVLAWTVAVGLAAGAYFIGVALGDPQLDLDRTVERER